MNKFLFFIIPILLIGCETNPPTIPEIVIEYGKVVITSNIDSADIFLDNINTGKVTPDTINASVGNHLITLKKPGYFDASINVIILKDSIIQKAIDLTNESGKVFVTSNVDGADIFLDNINTGKITPDTLITSVGNHYITLKKDGYFKSSVFVDVLKDSTILKTIEFTPPVFLANKTVLLEDFANVSCVPCVTSNKIIESLVNQTYGTTKLVAIKYPTNFPSPIDPFYLANSSECNARMSYYNIFVAPTTIIDGLLKPISTDSNDVKAKIEQRLSQIPKFKIAVKDSISGNEYFIQIVIHVNDPNGIDFSKLILHTIIKETNIEFTTPPGSNGETKFYDVMRKMLPDKDGESLTVLSTEISKTFERQFTLNSSWVQSNINTVVFIQNKDTKEVYQAGSTFN
jgi:hypothetical protein